MKNKPVARSLPAIAFVALLKEPFVICVNNNSVTANVYKNPEHTPVHDTEQNIGYCIIVPCDGELMTIFENEYVRLLASEEINKVI